MPVTALHGFNEAAGDPRGSRTVGSGWLCRSLRFNEAAGDPRGSPAVTATMLDTGSCASMRPREIPAEAGRLARLQGAISRCFNEAAGDPRGSHARMADIQRRHRRFNEAAGDPRGSQQGVELHAILPSEASMRPREIPAEAFRPRWRSSRSDCFNEAAGDPRRKPDDDAADGAVVGRASMRPREIPAEAPNSGLIASGDVLLQ